MRLACWIARPRWCERCSLGGYLLTGCRDGHFAFARNQAVTNENGDDGASEEDRADDGVDYRGGYHQRHGLRCVCGGNARPESDEAEEDLRPDDGMEQDARA